MKVQTVASSLTLTSVAPESSKLVSLTVYSPSYIISISHAPVEPAFQWGSRQGSVSMAMVTTFSFSSALARETQPSTMTRAIRRANSLRI